jgi:hypothetical protein
MRTRPGVIVRSTIVVIATAVIVGGWAIPTFAGRSFVEVTGRIVPVAGVPVVGREIVLPDGSAAVSGQVRLDIEITNRYPLPVMVDFRGSAFRARLIDRGATGVEPVWQASAEDPLLEQADESPDGSDSARVIRLPPGTTRLTTDGLALDLAATGAIAAGIYSLEISAYGVAGSPQSISIVDAALVGCDGSGHAAVLVRSLYGV